MFDFKSWGRLLTGKANYPQLVRVLRLQAKRQFVVTRKTPRRETPFEMNLRRLARRDLRLSFLCSEGDPLLDELREAGGNELRRLCAAGKATLDIIPRSDHTFSSLDDHERLLDVISRRVSTMIQSGKSRARVPEAALHDDVLAQDQVAVR